jgi:hypothetical protein
MNPLDSDVHAYLSTLSRYSIKSDVIFVVRPGRIYCCQARRHMLDVQAPCYTTPIHLTRPRKVPSQSTRRRNVDTSWFEKHSFKPRHTRQWRIENSCVLLNKVQLGTSSRPVVPLVRGTQSINIGSLNPRKKNKSFFFELQKRSIILKTIDHEWFNKSVGGTKWPFTPRIINILKHIFSDLSVTGYASLFRLMFS